MKKKKNKLIEAMEQFTKDLAAGNLDDYRITEVSKNDDGSYSFIEKHKGKVKKFTRKFKEKDA